MKNEKPISYRQLLEALQELTEDQLDMSASILDASINEMIPIYQTILISELPDEVQDEVDNEDSQPVLVINGVYE